MIIKYVIVLKVHNWRYIYLRLHIFRNFEVRFFKNLMKL